jgi:hypothetical protein
MSAALSPAMLDMLRNLAAGKSPTAGLTGRSAMGGASGTLTALHRRGLLKDMVVTAAGHEALKGSKP